MSAADPIAGRLRVGVTLPPGNVPVWQARCIELLCAVPGVEIALVLRDGARTPDPAAMAQSTARTILRSVFPGTHGRLLRATAGTHGRTVPAASILSVPASLSIAPDAKPESVVAVRRAASELDVLLHLSGSDPPEWLRPLPRYGTWVFHDGDPTLSAQVPAGFWDWFDKSPATGRALVALGNPANERTLLRCGWHQHWISSWMAAHERARTIGLEWPAMACQALLSNPGAGLAARRITAPVHAPARRFTTRVVATTCLREAIVALCRPIVRKARRMDMRQPVWGVAVVDAPIAAFLKGWPPRSKVRWIDRPSRLSFHADPFIASWGGRRAVLTEHVDRRSRRGAIVARDIGDDGRWSAARPVLRLPIHLSYPFLFEDDGELYCMPEAFQAGGVLLFRAAQFPDGWEFAGRLIDGFPAVDATILRHGGLYWLFCTDGANGPTRDLHLWFAPKLRGPWQPHPLNPVKIDVRSARPAGTPFTHEGRLYRPAQDCSRTYGGALVFNLVLELTPERFEEEAVAVLRPRRPDRFPHGIHHICAHGDTTLIDGKRWVLSVPKASDEVPPPDASEPLDQALTRYSAAGASR